MDKKSEEYAELALLSAVNADINQVDFNNVQPLTFTRPAAFSYFGDIYVQINSWNQLYIQVVKCLLNDYSDILRSYINSNISGRGRYDFADELRMKSMTAPKKVHDNFYLETNLNAKNIAGKIKKLLDLCSIDYENLKVYCLKQGSAEPVLKHQDISKEIQDRYSEILSEYFKDGYKPGAIFRGRFKRFYAEKYENTPAETDECIDKIMSMIGTKRDGRIFPTQDYRQNDLVIKIMNDILSAFDSGVTTIYIEAVYNKYRQPLADCLQIYDQAALTDLLLSNANGKYTKRYSFLTNSLSAGNERDDLLRVMKSFYQPQNYDSIHEKLWFLPYEKMKNILVTTDSIVNVAAETYFYAPNLPISTDELERLSLLIDEELNCHSYITDVRLMQLIKEKFPGIAINTDGYTRYGLRNCLGYILRERFTFTGSIITFKGKELSIADIFIKFAKDHEVLYVDELSAMSNEMGSGIYWDSVFSEMIRVSANKLVRKDLIKFDIEAIDGILEKICQQDYIPIREVNLFLHFPGIGYPWNSYLLESYLFGFSRKFRLMHSSFSKTGVYGAMVRKDANFKNYRSLLTDALSKSNSLDTANNALQYIVDKGYQKRKCYEDIETVIKDAKLIKEKREKK